MAPLAGASNPFGNNNGFFSVNPSQPPTSNEPDVIEIGDDDDEPANEEEESEVTNDEETEDTEEDGQSDYEPDPSETASVLNGPNMNFAQLDEGNTPELFTSAGAQQALHPLRRTADRVTRQIEAFAERLDRFKQKETRPFEFESFQAAYQLVKSYHTLTQDAMNELSKQRTMKRAKLGWNSSQNTKRAAPDPATTKIEYELARLELEADTWALLLDLIGIDDPHSRLAAVEAAKNAFQKLHRYSSDREVWDQFIHADHYAMECLVVMKWLEDTADVGLRDVGNTIAELEEKAERGQGLWTHGWLYTKEAIKGQKRLRAWPRPLEPNDPGIAVSLLNNESQKPLVTQLDPDAITRQKQTLLNQDQCYERATWAACWNMLRRGESWTAIREWAQERLENWRAVSLCGSSVDPNHCGETTTPADDSTARMANFRQQNSWRSACSALSRNPDVDDFQRAVYALLCGEAEPAYGACRSWDDYLYVYLNSVVLSRYQGFCKQLQRKITYSPAAPVAFVPETAMHMDLFRYLQHLKFNDYVAVEARNPYRMMQTAIITKSYDKYFYLLANSVSRVAAGKSDGSSIVPDLPPSPIDEDMLIAAGDEDALRISAHVYVIVRSMGYVRADTQSIETTSVNVIGHIATLEEAGLCELIPLYASLLPAELAQPVLGKVLIAIVDPRERRQQVRLMEKHGIDIEAVLEKQWVWVWNKVSAIEHPRTLTRYPKTILLSNGERELATVRKDYIGTDVSDDDEQIIRSLEWLRYIDGQWGKICHLGALTYRRFYITGKLAAARELSRRMSLSDISQKAFGFDIAEFPLIAENGVDKTSEPSSPSRSRILGSAHKRHRSSVSSGVPSGNEENLLVQQSQTMRELEQLIVAFDALETYAICYNKFMKSNQRRDSGTLQQLMEQLQESMDDAGYKIDSVLEVWLTGGQDETEKAELQQIRLTYVPELLLEYHNALYWAGRTLSEQFLIHCLHLANQISDNGTLLSSFTQSGRVSELVDVLAIASKAMVNTGKKRDTHGVFGDTLGIWHVEPDGEQDEEFHEFVRQARANAAHSNAI